LSPGVVVGVALAACHSEAPAPVDPPEPGVVASPDPGGEVGWPDAAIDPAGDVWVTWASVEADERTRLHLAVSRDGGQTFPDPVVLEDGPLFLGTVRQPVLAVDGERVAVAVGGGSYLASTVLLFVAPLAEPSAFERRELDAATLQGDVPPETVTLVDQPEVALDSEGEVWVTWKRSTVVEAVGFMLARESAGYRAERLDDGVRGQPCECCPVDLQFPGGRGLLAYRNNERNNRDIYLLDVELGRAARVSSEAWRIGGCPFDGPSLAVVDRDMVASWVDGTQGDNYAFTAHSGDGGQTWSPAALLFAGRDESMTWPTLAVDGGGAVWLSAEAIYIRTRIALSADGGRTFTEVALDGPPLFFAEVAAGGGRVGLVGVGEDGAVLYEPLGG
jgi:hypothetical protein